MDKNTCTKTHRHRCIHSKEELCQQSSRPPLTPLTHSRDLRLNSLYSKGATGNYHLLLHCTMCSQLLALTAQRSEGSKALPLGCQHYSGRLTAKLPEEAGSLSLLEKLVLTESSCTDARARGGILGSVNMLFQEQVMPIRCRV